LEQGIEDYLKRLSRYGSVDLVRVKEETKLDRQAEAQAIQREGERLLKQIRPGDRLIALSEEGSLLDSANWAKAISQLTQNTSGRLCFVIGSGAGLSTQVKQAADRTLSLSSLTFPHQLALILLLEQLYRAQTILHNEPYHR
jgi:23S rRNA (pseudouridine1915-N3)-methyltransferase